MPALRASGFRSPLPPRENHLDFEVFAGEQRPAVDVARVLTYSAPSGA